jgi:hypothetical protein
MVTRERSPSPSGSITHRCPLIRDPDTDPILLAGGLHDVVVATAREAADAIDGIAARADHDHGHVAVPAPARLTVSEAAAELEARRVGEELDRLLRRQ